MDINDIEILEPGHITWMWEGATEANQKSIPACMACA